MGVALEGRINRPLIKSNPIILNKNPTKKPNNEENNLYNTIHQKRQYV